MGRSVKIVSGDIGMKFGMDKCAVLKMKRGKQVQYEGIDLREGMMIDEANQKVYKHLGILKREDICQDEMKEMVRKEYFK